MLKITALILGVTLSAAAHSESREDSMNRLVKAQGLTEIFEQQKRYVKVEGEKQAKKILDQILSQMNPNEAFKKKFSDAFMGYIKKLESPWSSEEMASVWSKYYSANFTDSELKKLVEFYESPLGQKERDSSKDALMKFSEHFRKLGEPIFEKATNEYITQLQITAKECNCRK